jgi:hypothetical protein
MKKVIIFALLITTLYSCKTYNNTIQERYVSRDPVRYDTTKLINNHPTPIYDSIYVVAPTWKQAYKKSSKLFTIGGTAITVGSLAVAPTLYNPTTIAPVAISGLIITGGSLEWYRWNYNKEITKTQYDSLMKVDGNLHAFWSAQK